MNCLNIIASVDGRSGGPVAGIISLFKRESSDFKSEVLSLDDPNSEYVNEFPLKVHAVGPPVGPKFRYNPLYHYRYSPKMVSWLREHASKYDAIIVHGLWNYSSFGASRVLPRMSVPYFVFIHGMMDPWFKRTYPIKHFFKQLFWLLAEGPLIKGSAAVIFTAEEERVLARGVFLGYAGYNEYVCRYGADDPPTEEEDQRTAFRKALPGLGDRSYLLYLSRIHRKKGCDLLIEAFHKIAFIRPDLQLVIAGPDQEGLQSGLIRRATELGIAGRIHWPGMVEGSVKWGAFRGAEAFILPSHQENFGIVLAEAMACRTPVLTTDKVNIWREIEKSGGGFIETDNQAGIDNLLKRWIQIPEDQKERMRSQARVGFETYFNMSHAAQNLCEVIAGHIRKT